MKPASASPAAAAGQLELFASGPARTEAELAGRLTAVSPLPLRLTITRNRVAMASARFRSGLAEMRLDAAFLSAPEPVVEALSAYLRRPSARAWRKVRDFARSIAVEARPARAARVVTAGCMHDLEAIRQRVNARFFGGRLSCRITWGRRSAPRRGARGRSIRYGTYSRAEDLVRINPLLDDPRVPQVFVEYIVFHEMLHAVVPSRRGRRWNHHHAAYRTLEKQFPDLEAMQRLASELVGRLAIAPRALTSASPAVP